MLRVLVFTDEPVVTAGLSSVLSRKNGFKVVGVSSDPATLLETALAARPDLLLLDMVPELTFGILVEMQKRMPGCRIVVWVRTISNEMAYQAVENGIRGVLRKTLPMDTQVKCLRMVAEGGLWYEDGLRAGFQTARAVRLSPRESQLVSLLAQGLKNKEISSLLLISEGTVKVYLSRLFRKLGVKDRFELALYGLRNMPESMESVHPGPRLVPTTRLKKDGTDPAWLRSILLDRRQERVGRVAG